MRQYELTVVLKPDLETELDSVLTKIRRIVTDNGGTITSEDNWGKKRLAYRINKEDFGVYVYFEVELSAEAVAKVNATLNITDDVLRYLLVKVDEKGRAALEDAKKRALERGTDEDSEEY